MIDQALRDKLFVALGGVTSSARHIRPQLDLNEMILEDLEKLEPVIEQAIAEAVVGVAEKPTHAMRVWYEILGGHAHLTIFVGNSGNGFTLGRAGQFVMTLDEFAAWQAGRLAIEFQRKEIR